jgi:eukaryotic-like serine/threonine-protein kinase
MSTPSSSPQRIGDYEVLASLGAGGMGHVFKVRNVISNREEAMKVLLPDFAAQPELAARFLAEIRTLAGLEHPNIAQLRTAFQYQNHFVMVMEYVEGSTLEKLASEGRIPLEQMLDYASQVLAGLSYAHSHGVTHRDIKPANIMVTSHGVAKLMDFGIAKSTEDLQLTRPGTTMGSVYYMSPEQVQGGAIDARSDIYSFGVTLYEMFTGRKPFVSESSYTVLNAQINEAPVPLTEVNPNLPVELNNIVLKSMAKDPAARYQTAEEFREALRRLREPKAAPVPVPAQAPVMAAPPVAAAMSATAAVSAGAAPGPAPGGVPAASVQEPRFEPVPQVPAAVVQQKQGKGHRGLWIAMGAVAAVLAIVAVATLAPRFYPMLAGKSAAQPTAAPAQAPAAPTETAGAATQPASTPAAPAQASGSASSPATSPQSTAAPVSSAMPHMSKSLVPCRPEGQQYQPMDEKMPCAKGTGSTAGLAQSASAASATAAPAGPSAAEIREVSDKLMNLNARADAARNGVQALRTQQQAQGLDIRGDVLAAMGRMNGLLNEAQRALDRKELDAANDYMDRAEKDVAKLETFLGK